MGDAHADETQLFVGLVDVEQFAGHVVFDFEQQRVVLWGEVGARCGKHDVLGFGILAPFGVGVEVVYELYGIALEVDFVEQGALDHVAGAEQLYEGLAFEDSARIQATDVKAKLGQEVLPARGFALFDRNDHVRLELRGLEDEAAEAKTGAKDGEEGYALPLLGDTGQQPALELLDVLEGDSALKKFGKSTHGLAK